MHALDVITEFYNTRRLYSATATSHQPKPSKNRRVVGHRLAMVFKLADPPRPARTRPVCAEAVRTEPESTGSARAP